MSRLPACSASPAGSVQVSPRSGADRERLRHVDVAAMAVDRRVRDAPLCDFVLTPPFESFFERERDRLVRAMAIITGSRWEAEDLAQTAFVKVFERWDTVSKMDEPAGYLHRTAMNLFRNQHRRARVALGRIVRAVPPPDVFASIEDRDVATRALGALTPRQRAALVLTEALGYSGAEAGELLGIKASTVFALTHQARAALQLSAEADRVR